MTSQESNRDAKAAELDRRLERIHAMGGPERVERQHGQGKLTARERLQCLLDPDS